VIALVRSSHALNQYAIVPHGERGRWHLIALSEAGMPGDGPVLVLYSRLVTAGIFGNHQVDKFRKDHRSASFDPRSQGESTKTTSGHAGDTRARFHALLERLGVRHPVLIVGLGVQDPRRLFERYGTKARRNCVGGFGIPMHGRVPHARQETAAQFNVRGHQRIKGYLGELCRQSLSKPPSDSRSKGCAQG